MRRETGSRPKPHVPNQGHCSEDGKEPGPPRSTPPKRAICHRLGIMGIAGRRDQAFDAFRKVLELAGASHGRVGRSGHLSRFRKDCQVFGLEVALSELKARSNAWRSDWVLDGAPDSIGQLSALGRSLPKGTPEAVRGSIRQHFLDYSNGVQTPRGVLSYAQAFARRWAIQYCYRRSRMAAPDLATRSGCFERPAAKGGLRAEIDSWGEHARLDAVMGSEEVAQDLGRLPDQDVAALRWSTNLLLHSYEHLPRDVPKAKVSAIQERGLKVRTVTTSEAGLHIAGHIVRKRLLDGLRHDPRSQSTLLGVDWGQIQQDGVGLPAHAVSTAPSVSRR